MTTQPQKILLTGASSGIGAALAKTLCARGHQVWVAARRADRLDALIAEITAAGGHAVAIALDVSDHEACAALAAALDAEVSGFDVVVANAGVGGRQTSIWKIAVDDAKAVVDTNFTGALASILPLLPLMRARGRGHVVGVSSLAADLSQPMAPVYGATKSALTFFMDSIAPELEAHGLAVTIVHPGFVKSEMTAKNAFPMPFLVETDAAAVMIADAIERKKAWLRFPLGMSMTMGLAGLLPRGLRAKIVSGSTRQ